MEDKVEPIVYLGIDEGAGVDDLDIVGLMHHHSLDVFLPPPPSGQTPEPKSPCLLLRFCPSFRLGDFGATVLTDVLTHYFSKMAEVFP